MLEKIRGVGIDWNETRPVESISETAFTGTFTPSTEAEWLIGTLYTLDGEHYIFAYKDQDGMGSYIQNIWKMMNLKDETESFMAQFT